MKSHRRGKNGKTNDEKIKAASEAEGSKSSEPPAQENTTGGSENMAVAVCACCPGGDNTALWIAMETSH